MAVSWESFHAYNREVVAEWGRAVWLLDKDWAPVMPIEAYESPSFPQEFNDTGSMSMVLPGEVGGSMHPAINWLLTNDLSGRFDFGQPGALDAIFHSAASILVDYGQRADGSPNRVVYRIFELTPEGGVDRPEKMTVTGLSSLEYLKHLPLWADPSNRSKVVQLQFDDTQQGSAEFVSRKLIGRNLIGYFQPSMLNQAFDGQVGSFTMTEDYADPARWSPMISPMHRIICSPVESGLPSEWAIITARWDNAWDLLKATWDAAGIMSTVDLWVPGDPQPFPQHTTLLQPTMVVDFTPRATVSGAAGLLSQGWAELKRRIDTDKFTDSILFEGGSVPTKDGRPPWVVFEFADAPQVTIRKSTDSQVLVGGKSPKIVNDVVEVGVKTALAAAVSLIPGLGPGLAELIKGGGELLGKMAADRFLNLNEYTDRNRATHHGRSGYVSVSKIGEANSMDSLQKAWQAKEETGGGLSVNFAVESEYPYRPGVDFHLGDTVGVRAWGMIFAAYVSSLTDVGEPGQSRWEITLGDVRSLRNPTELLAKNAESVSAIVSRIQTASGA